MLNVWCMNTGGHAPVAEVETLKRQVSRHLQQPHEFHCITKSDLPGWWGKVRLFDKSISRARNLWLDLDVCILGPIDELTKPLNGSCLRIARNWANSGHGGCQSSVMYWEKCSAQIISDSFNPADAHWPPRTDKFWDNGQVCWGDQEWITYMRDTKKIEVEYFNNDLVKSYKYHCRENVPKNTRVVVFHGKPKPADVADRWVQVARL